MEDNDYISKQNDPQTVTSPYSYQNQPGNYPQQNRTPGIIFLRSGWVKFMAIMYFIWGALCCVSIIGAIVGVPIIFAGIRLQKAHVALGNMINSADQSLANEAIDNFIKHFFIMSILTIVYIAFMLLYLGIILVGIILAVIAASGKR